MTCIDRQRIGGGDRRARIDRSPRRDADRDRGHADIYALGCEVTARALLMNQLTISGRAPMPPARPS